jgi:hypothetical protein
MTHLTLRPIKDHFLIIGPDMEPMRFKSRSEARDWCRAHYPGSPIKESGARRSGATSNQGAFDCRQQWPPVDVAVGDILTLAGYLEIHGEQKSRGGSTKWRLGEDTAWSRMSAIVTF